MALDIGRIAYQAWSDKMDSLSCPEGFIASKWEELNQMEQDAWRASACAVLRYMDKCFFEMKNNPDAIG
jgi:hypothetical protein